MMLTRKTIVVVYFVVVYIIQRKTNARNVNTHVLLPYVSLQTTTQSTLVSTSLLVFLFLVYFCWYL